MRLHWRWAAIGYVADAPGIREFGLAGLRKDELAQHYPETVMRGLDCRFADCMHTDEPGCVVGTAVGGGARHPVAGPLGGLSKSTPSATVDNYACCLRTISRARACIDKVIASHRVTAGCCCWLLHEAVSSFREKPRTDVTFGTG